MTCKTGPGRLSAAIRRLFGLADAWAGRLLLCVDASVGEGSTAMPALADRDVGAASTLNTRAPLAAVSMVGPSSASGFGLPAKLADRVRRTMTCVDV
jgi:hypothetical protein